MSIRILTVDDREGIRLFIRDTLVTRGYIVDVASDGREALTLLQKNEYQLLITDLKMPRMDGMALLRETRTLFPQLPVIVLTAHGTIQNAVAAMKLGAVDYLTKPLDSPAALRQVVEAHLPVINAASTAESMVATDHKMRSILALIDKVAPTDATVLLTGESGTGKEVAAARIHKMSKRSEQPFVAVNCAAISGTLMESEMFGHEKGAFTGATEQKRGRFEMAHRGTLFLDEVGELAPALQAKLLRVLQEQKFERVGGSASIEVDVRIIAATNRDLAAEITAGRFRDDLYHRLTVFPIHLPPLHQRPDDILPLARFFLSKISQKQNRNLSLSDDACAALQAYRWPGNIRELSNIMERAAIMCASPVIAESDLIFAPGSGSIKSSISVQNTPDLSLKNIEKDAILKALSETDGHRKNAATLLGISLRSLYNKLKEYDIE